MRWRTALRDGVERALWVLFGRPTSKMWRELEEEAKKYPPHPKPGKTYISG